MKNDCSSESFGVRAQGGLFGNMRSTDEVTLGVGLFSSVGCISSVGHISSVGRISSVGLRVVAFLG